MQKKFGRIVPYILSFSTLSITLVLFQNCGKLESISQLTGENNQSSQAPNGGSDGSNPSTGGNFPVGGNPVLPPGTTQPTDITRLPIVYVWSEKSAPRSFLARGGINYNNVAFDNYDPLPDVAAITGGFKKSNIVDRAADGTEHTIFDCINNVSAHCAALDPKVSPDNTKIAFTVLFAAGVNSTRWTLFGDMPIENLGEPAAAVIYIYDTQSRTLTSWPRVQGVLDMSPDWISNTKLVFVSNRAKIYPVKMFGLTTPYPNTYALQRWTANIDGSNAVNIGPHDDMALHPMVLSDGNILTSTWRVDEHLSAGVTPANQYWMTLTNQFGGNEVSAYGAHGKMFSEKGTVLWDEQIALHFFGERSNGDIMTANYYRGNNMGLGLLIAFPKLPYGVEGETNSFQPNVYRLLPWAQEQDDEAMKDSNGRYMGKAGYPAGLPGGQVLLTYGHGTCYSALDVANANSIYLGGAPGCDTGIYVQKTFPSLGPSDLSLVVDRPDRHEFAARVRLPYSDIYGQAAPLQQQPPVNQGFCSLEVVNARSGVLITGGKMCSKEGACIQPGFSVADVDKLAIYEAIPNTQPENVTGPATNLEGQAMRLLGYATPEADGSVNVRIPCDTPYKLRGVATTSEEFIRDQVKHSNRPGEARTCQGCHAGHNKADHIADVKSAFLSTLAGRKPASFLSPTR